MFQRKINGKIMCELCPNMCILDKNEIGKCNVRQNRKGILRSLNYGHIISRAIDPIEKKPLFHFFPGSFTYSIAASGCNLHCKFCQNHEISQKFIESGKLFTPLDIVNDALKHGCKSIAYTYTEPTIFFEFALETMKLAKEKGLKNIWVSNGYINPRPLKKIIPSLDAVNIDLKGDKNFYEEISEGKIEPVLNTIKTLFKKQILVEISNLLITDLNDSKEQIEFIVDTISNISRKIPLHFSKYRSSYKLKNNSTSLESIKRAMTIAKEKLDYVYGGNIRGQGLENTRCPKCNFVVIIRDRDQVSSFLGKAKTCPKCNETIKLIGNL